MNSELEVFLASCGYQPTAGSDNFFTSPRWFIPYLNSWPDSKPEFLQINPADPTAGFVALNSARRKSALGFRYRAYAINQCLDASMLDATLEFNGPFCRTSAISSDWIDSLMQALVKKPDCDEAIFSSLSCDDSRRLLLLAKQHNWIVQLQEAKPSYLTMLPAREVAQEVNVADQIATGFSANSRAHIKRCIRKVETKFGVLRLITAESSAQIDSWIKQMGQWHASRWAHTSDAGGFNNPVFVSFQQKLAIENLRSNTLRFHQVLAGDVVLGYLMNFRWDDTELAYVGAYNYENAHEYSPGLLTHFAAMCEAAKTNAKVYDFLRGYSRYKESFSNVKAEVHNVTLRRNLMHFRIEQSLKALKKLTRH